MSAAAAAAAAALDAMSDSESDFSGLEEMAMEVRRARKQQELDGSSTETARKGKTAQRGEDDDESSDVDDEAATVGFDESELSAIAASQASKMKAIKSAKTKKGKKKQQKKDKQQEEEERGVVYLGHIPYGFFETQMREFFAQFGEVTRLRLARSKRTGNSKHYAFIEFASREVAEIVAEVMDKYMMFGRTLVCDVVPPERVHPRTFENADRKFRQVPWSRISRERHNRQRTAAEQEKRRARLLARENKTRTKLAQLGIEYDFPGYKASAGETGAKDVVAAAAAAAEPEKKSKGKGKRKKQVEPEEPEQEEVVAKKADKPKKRRKQKKKRKTA